MDKREYNRNYQREYRKEHREKLNANRRESYKNNRETVTLLQNDIMDLMMLVGELGEELKSSECERARQQVEIMKLKKINRKMKYELERLYRENPRGRYKDSEKRWKALIDVSDQLKDYRYERCKEIDNMLLETANSILDRHCIENIEDIGQAHELYKFTSPKKTIKCSD